MKYNGWILFIIFCWSCKDKFTPELAASTGTGILVVEGFINSGNDSTRIKLSRTSGLDTIRFIPEKKALVSVESETGTSFPLTEKGGGLYVAGPIPINSAQKYRVHIRANDGKEFESALVSVKYTPPIDSVGWTPESDHISIYVSTHDDRDSSRYYEWTYTEAWVSQAPFISYYYYSPQKPPKRLKGDFKPRPGSEIGKYQTCYQADSSHDIQIASSAKLSKDVVSRFPIADIPYTTTDRLVNRYSIEVRQRVLTQEGYEWEEKLKKNTQNLGSIFDPLPTQTGGNLQCISDPGTPVIGYVWCTSETLKRIFIFHTELPPVHISSGYEDCAKDTVPDGTEKADSVRNEKFYGAGTWLPLDYFFDADGLGYSIAGPAGCVDCRLKGGTIDKPAFW